MKRTSNFTRLFFTLSFIFFIVPNTNAQLWKKLKKKAEQAIERKLEQKIEKEAEKTMDSILNPNENPSNRKNPNSTPTKKTEDNSPSDKKHSEKTTNTHEEFKINSKFDFVPGDKLLFFDDFNQEFIGDFPSKWDTNASGEIVTFNDSPEKWFEFKAGYDLFYSPLFNLFPNEFTIEFDILIKGLDDSDIFGTELIIQLDDNAKDFKKGRNYVIVDLPLNSSYDSDKLSVANRINGESIINSSIDIDVKNLLSHSLHISIAVNKQRYRFWINQTKYIDIPRMIGSSISMKSLKLNFTTFKSIGQRFFIKNLKIAEGGLDLRSKLISDGRVSTNGILFDSGSAKIKPQSYGIIRQISQVLLQDKTMRLNIIGHTDSDGDSNVNLELSKARAETIKKALIAVYKIGEERIETEGKGENIPVADNTTTNGKALNRRVEFIKL